jgi:hypothetical protein
VIAVEAVAALISLKKVARQQHIRCRYPCGWAVSSHHPVCWRTPEVSDMRRGLHSFSFRTDVPNT